MSHATGIHVSGRKLRLVALEGNAGDYTVAALAEVDLGETLCPRALQSPESRRRISETVRQDLRNGPRPRGKCVVALGGGLYQIQRVPLELASDEDRREQVLWEAAQSLVSPPDEYVLEVYATGRAAFWVAYRRRVVDAYVRLFEDSGIVVDSVAAEPVAMARAGTIAQERGSELTGVVHWESPWLSFVLIHDGQMVAAETARAAAPGNGSGDTHAHTYGDVPSTPPDLAEVARRWASSDLSADRRRAPCQKILLCGNSEELGRLAGQLRSPAGPEVSRLDPFCACDTSGLPAEQLDYLGAPSSFGVAAGLAHIGLFGVPGEGERGTSHLAGHLDSTRNDAAGIHVSKRRRPEDLE